MITITVAFEVSAAAFARVKALSREVALRDVNFNGADIRVVRDDFTSVDDVDELRGAGLLSRVQHAIDNDA